MPSRPSHTCACGQPYRPGPGRCPYCAADRRTRTYSHRDYITNRAALLAGAPPCAHCGAPATTADHIDGDPTNHALTNLQPLCRPCNSRKADR